MTNFDVIKQMTVEQLGKFLNHIDCAGGITKWLEREADWWMSDYIKENNV